MRYLVICFVCFAGFFPVTTAILNAQPGSTETENSRQMLHPDAPSETRLLAQLFGTWDAYQVKRNRDGSWSGDTTHYEWRWYPILDGHGIQDDWLTFAGVDGRADTSIVVGTNIRIYNAGENQWHMAWIDKTNRRLATFTAKNDNGKVVMSGKNAQGREVRNTFLNFSGDQFDWKQVWSFDGGSSWVEVSRIHCVRKK